MNFKNFTILRFFVSVFMWPAISSASDGYMVPGYTDTTSCSPQSSCQAAIPHMCSGDSNCSGSVKQADASHCVITRCEYGCNWSQQDQSLGMSRVPDGCQNCTQETPAQGLAHGTQKYHGTSVADGGFCSTGCRYVLVPEPTGSDGQGPEASIELGFNCTGSGSQVCDYYGVYRRTDEVCNGNTNLSASDKGNLDCTGPDCGGKYCGDVNGANVCVDGVKDGECAITPGGNTICVESPHAAPNQPTDPQLGRISSPDSGFVAPGTGGSGGGGTVGVFPGDGGTAGNGQGWNNGSPNGKGNGNGNCTGPDCGNGDGSGDGTMGNGKYGRDLGNVREFSESTQALKDGFGSFMSPSVSVSVPGGNCPFTTPFMIGGHSYSFSQMCSVWSDTVAPTLSSVMTVLWYIAGFFIIWSA